MHIHAALLAGLLAAPAAAASCFDLVMTDAWADGWDNGSYVFSDAASGTVAASGTLLDGANETEAVCLADGCYRLDVAGAAYPSEVGFDFGAGFLSGDGDFSSTFGVAAAALASTCETCFALAMTDAWADGWDNGTYAFTDGGGGVVASGTLDDGAYGVDEVCLQDGCYALAVVGTAYASEVGFNVSAPDGTVVLEGDGDFYAAFSLAAGVKGPACEGSHGTHCYDLELADSAGDGWDGTTYTVTDADGAVVATGAVDDGEAAKTDTLCFADGCYEIDVGGGDFLSEKTWNLGGDLPGAAPQTKAFRLAGGAVYDTCDTPVPTATAGPTLVPTATPAPTATRAPTAAERDVATEADLRALLQVWDEAYAEVAVVAAEIDIAAEIVVANGRDRKVTGGVLDGGGTTRLLTVNGPTSRLRLFSMTLKNGADAAGSGGAVRAENGSTLVLSAVTIRGSVARYGGAVAVEAGAKAMLYGTTLSGNTAGDSGGAAYVHEATLEDRNGIWDGNVAANSCGALRAYKARVLLTGTTVSANEAVNFDGGALCALLSNTIWGTTLPGAGLFLENAAVTDNACDGDGGGIYNSESALEIRASTVSGNVAYDGGGVYDWIGARTVLFASTLAGNVAERRGGAVYGRDAAKVLIEASAVRGNAAGDAGGAVYGDLRAADRIEARNSTFDDNSAGGEGGAVAAAGGSLVASGANFTRCAASIGGAVSLAATAASFDGSRFEGNNATFGGAVATTGGGEYLDFAGVVALANVARAQGGVVYCSASPCRVRGAAGRPARFDANVAVQGAAIFVPAYAVADVAHVALARSLVVYGTIFLSLGVVATVTDVASEDNVALQVGALAFLGARGELALARATSRDDAATFSGVVYASAESTLSLVDVAIDDAAVGAGAIFATGARAVDLADVTVAGSVARGSGAAVYLQGTEAFTAADCTFASNTGGAGGAVLYAAFYIFFFFVTRPLARRS